MADVRLAHHRNKQAPRPGQGGTSRNPPPHETPPADRQDRSAASSDRRHRKTLADLAWNRLRFVQNDGIRNEPNWRVVEMSRYPLLGGFGVIYGEVLMLTNHIAYLAAQGQWNDDLMKQVSPPQPIVPVEVPGEKSH